MFYQEFDGKFVTGFHELVPTFSFRQNLMVFLPSFCDEHQKTAVARIVWLQLSLWTMVNICGISYFWLVESHQYRKLPYVLRQYLRSFLFFFFNAVLCYLFCCYKSFAICWTLASKISFPSLNGQSNYISVTSQLHVSMGIAKNLFHYRMIVNLTWIFFLPLKYQLMFATRDNILSRSVLPCSDHNDTDKCCFVSIVMFFYSLMFVVYTRVQYSYIQKKRSPC